MGVAVVHGKDLCHILATIVSQKRTSVVFLPQKEVICIHVPVMTSRFIHTPPLHVERQAY